MIEVRDLRKMYRDRPVLEGVTFSIQAGETVGFLGANGAGKTTTMRILTGFLAPSSGTAIVAGHDVSREPLKVKGKVGYLPEHPPLYEEMRVVEYLRFVAQMRGLTGPRARSRVGEVLALCSLEACAERPLSELSRGYRQRAGIAQALVADPPVLILDEPTSGLDPVQAARTRDLIRRLSSGRTILFSTHILSEVEAVADRVIVLARGRIAADGPIHALASQHPAERLLVRFSREVPEANEVLAGLPGVRGVLDLPRGKGPGALVLVQAGSDSAVTVAKAAATRHWPLAEITPSPHGLEQLFFSILGEEVRV
jgi:ABC-2 type transport system ATP-binding protein